MTAGNHIWLGAGHCLALSFRPILRLLVLLACLLSSNSGAPTVAQEPIRVSGEPTCESCRIVLDTVFAVGGLDGPGTHTHLLDGNMTRVAVDQWDRILISNMIQSEIAGFDPQGNFLRTVGRRGEGPGECMSMSDVNAGPRYIHVFQYDRGRTMLDYDFNVVRVDRFTGQANVSEAVHFGALSPMQTLALPMRWATSSIPSVLKVK